MKRSLEGNGRIIEVMRISKFVLVLPLILLVVLLLFSKTAMFSLLDNSLAQMLIVLFAIVLEAVYCMIYFGTKVTLYEGRIKIEKVWPKLMHIDIPLNKVNGVTASGSDLFGNLTINTSSGNYEFHYASKPFLFRDAVMNEIEERDFRRMKQQARAIRDEFDD